MMGGYQQRWQSYKRCR